MSHCGRENRSTKETMESQTQFYHYTSERGMQRIIKSGYIRVSNDDNNHAHFGEGVYGTSLPPSSGRETIAWNNWTRHGVFHIAKGNVSHAIEVSIPTNKVKRAGNNRDILVHLGGPIQLEEYDWKAWEVPESPGSSPRLLKKEKRSTTSILEGVGSLAVIMGAGLLVASLFSRD